MLASDWLERRDCHVHKFCKMCVSSRQCPRPRYRGLSSPRWKESTPRLRFLLCGPPRRVVGNRKQEREEEWSDLDVSAEREARPGTTRKHQERCVAAVWLLWPCWHASRSRVFQVRTPPCKTCWTDLWSCSWKGLVRASSSALAMLQCNKST